MTIDIILIYQPALCLKDWRLFWWFSPLCSLVAGGLKIQMIKSEVLTLESETTWSIAAGWLERCLNCCPFFNISLFFCLFYDVVRQTPTVVMLHAKQSEVITDRTAGLAPPPPCCQVIQASLDLWTSQGWHRNVQKIHVLTVFVLFDNWLDQTVIQWLTVDNTKECDSDEVEGEEEDGVQQYLWRLLSYEDKAVLNTKAFSLHFFGFHSRGSIFTVNPHRPHYFLYDFSKTPLFKWHISQVKHSLCLQRNLSVLNVGLV